MPLGLRQNNNLLHLTLDIWQEQIFSTRLRIHPDISLLKF